jgi:CBS domain-containing protein
MAGKVKDLMNTSLIKLGASSSVLDAARQMMSRDISAVIVEDLGTLYGIVTGRDIVVRAIAPGKNLAATPLHEICSKVPIALSQDDDLDDAAKAMQERAIALAPVVDDYQDAVGILSLSDLGVERDQKLSGRRQGEELANPWWSTMPSSR